MGEQCKLYDSETGRAQKLSRYHKENICGRCLREGYTPSDAQPTDDTHATTPRSSTGASELCSQCRKNPAITQLVLEKDGKKENTPLCEGCQNRLIEQVQEHGYFTYLPPGGEESRPPPEEVFEELFRAGTTLLKSDIAEEDLIIPTLAFANRASALPELKTLRDQFAKIEDSGTPLGQFSQRCS